MNENAQLKSNADAPLMIFDMDGTLYPALDVILRSVHSTLDALKLPDVSDSLILPLIGEAYSVFVPAIAPDYKDYDEFERVYHSIEVKAINEQGVLYDGIVEMLDELRQMGCAVVLCSNGTVGYMEMSATELGIRDKFDLLLSGGDYSSKADAVAEIMRRFPRPITVMTGDRHHDVTAGNRNGAVSVGAMYGYGSERELAPAQFKINSPRELIGIVKTLTS
jgi:phosphoglycolate phosphatase